MGMYYKKWVCNESKRVCTVESGPVGSKNGSVPKKAGL